MEKRLYGIRGATGAENTAASVTENVCRMLNEIYGRNNIADNDTVSIQFTVTKDLNLMNPAAALRKGRTDFDFSKCALFCSQEPEITGSPEKMIRVLVTAYLPEGAEVSHVYINGGEKLRPDFAAK